MTISVKINNQNQQKVRTLTPLAAQITSITQIPDIAVVNVSNNSTLVYNTLTSKYEVKTLPVIYGGTF